MSHMHNLATVGVPGISNWVSCVSQCATVPSTVNAQQMSLLGHVMMQLSIVNFLLFTVLYGIVSS